MARSVVRGQPDAEDDAGDEEGMADENGGEEARGGGEAAGQTDNGQYLTDEGRCSLYGNTPSHPPGRPDTDYIGSRAPGQQN